LIDRIKNGETLTDDEDSVIETVYPLGINPAILKGTKPTAVYFGKEKVDVKT